jgi:peptidoglycan-N-acetylglucosamine deacetylase
MPGPWRRGVLGLAIVVVLLLAAVVPVGAVAGFRDVPPGAFYTAAVQWARNTGITTGVGGTDRFEPMRNVTRAESATMIWRYVGSPRGSAQRFADQVPGSWYDAALLWGRGRITTGVGGSNYFEPNRSVTRAELVTMIYRAAGSPAVHIDPNPPYQPPPPEPPPPKPSGTPMYLTFDDGPHPTWTPRVLDALRRHGARATFFATGAQVQRYPALARRIVAEGHRIENHTMNHARLTNLSWNGVRAELSSANQAIRVAVGRGTTCFRPPYGATSRTVVDAANSLGHRQVLWTVDPSDWKRPPSSQIASVVLRNIRPGGVVLLHDGGGDRSRTVAALDTILPELRRRGYSFGLVCG